MYIGSNCTQGFIKDILEILTKYNLVEYLLSYVETAHFPTELTWKSIVRKAISTQQIHNWSAGIDAKPELEYYGLIHQDLKPLELWSVVFRNPVFLKAIVNTVNVISGNVLSTIMSKITVRENDVLCRICGIESCITSPTIL